MGGRVDGPARFLPIQGDTRMSNETKPSLKLGHTLYQQTFFLNMAVPGTENDAEPVLTGWILELAGPGHPKTIEINNRQATAANKKIADKEQARVNGKKWKPE